MIIGISLVSNYIEGRREANPAEQPMPIERLSLRGSTCGRPRPATPASPSPARSHGSAPNRRSPLRVTRPHGVSRLTAVSARRFKIVRDPLRQQDTSGTAFERPKHGSLDHRCRAPAAKPSRILCTSYPLLCDVPAGWRPGLLALEGTLHEPSHQLPLKEHDDDEHGQQGDDGACHHYVYGIDLLRAQARQPDLHRSIGV
jgi:hypothetical protein